MQSGGWRREVRQAGTYEKGEKPAHDRGPLEGCSTLLCKLTAVDLAQTKRDTSIELRMLHDVVPRTVSRKAPPPR